MELQPIILSLFDYTGTWSEPYRRAGYRVIQIDIKLGLSVYDFKEKEVKGKVFGIICAPPCYDFTIAVNRLWKEKDESGQTAKSVRLVKRALEIKDFLSPEFWVLENPVGRLPKLCPELGEPWYFEPYEFGDPWTKKTGLWGNFNKPKKSPVPILTYSESGSTFYGTAVGGKSEKTKEIRSITPAGFAWQFYFANSINRNDLSLRKFIPPGIKTKECKCCGKGFLPQVGKAVFCSGACRQKAHRQKKATSL